MNYTTIIPCILRKKKYLPMKNTAIILYHILMRLCGLLLAYKQLNFVFFYSNIGIFFYIENDGEQNTQFQYTPEI